MSKLTTEKAMKGRNVHFQNFFFKNKKQVNRSLNFPTLPNHVPELSVNSPTCLVCEHCQKLPSSLIVAHLVATCGAQLYSAFKNGIPVEAFRSIN
eukprot:scaffold948_cov106-Cylindrotheca_fusiformis.AAC.2